MCAVLINRESPARRMSSKVPEVTLWFWIIKILCTTVGESFADYVNETLGFGLTNTTITNTTNTTITYAFPDNGVYTVTLRATDDDGDSDNTTRVVTVTNVAPTVNITGEPYATTISSTITLNATGSDVPADPLTYAWDLDNNGSFETAGQAVPFSSTITGTFTVTVQVSDGDGGTATDTTTVTVNSVLPLALLGVGYGWFRRKQRHKRLRHGG